MSTPSKQQTSDHDDSQRSALPFEPGKSRKKTEKKAPPVAPSPGSLGRSPASSNRSTAQASARIPEVVSRRMIRRMALFCGLPSALGISTFFVSYWVVVNEWFVLPHVAVLLVSLGFFGLGVVGLSYGVLSASWDEESTGSWLGVSEFRENAGRMVQAWKTTRSNYQKNQ